MIATRIAALFDNFDPAREDTKSKDRGVMQVDNMLYVENDDRIRRELHVYDRVSSNTANSEPKTAKFQSSHIVVTKVLNTLYYVYL